MRGSARSRRKNSRIFAIFNMLARPSAGIGVAEVQQLEVFCDFYSSRATLCGNRRAKTRGFLRLLLFELVLELSRGSRTCSRDRRVAGSIPPWSAGGRRKMQLAQSNLRRATCAEQVAQSNLRRPTDQFVQSALPRATCAEQLTQSNLHRATCTEQLAQSNLQGATCTEQFAQSNLQGATCRDQLARSNLRGATCAEQLAQCNLRRGTCADQLAPASLRRAPCLVLSRACFTNASCREKERILQRWADLACDVMLSGQPWSSLFACLFQAVCSLLSHVKIPIAAQETCRIMRLSMGRSSDFPGNSCAGQLISSDILGSFPLSLFSRAVFPNA